jgi:hypothetical protein
LKKSFGGGERNFPEPLMRFVRNDVRRPRRFSEKRPRTFVLALCSIPAADLSKNQHLRDFWSFSIFDFFNSIDPYRKWSILHGGRFSAEATLFSWLWNHSPVMNFVSDRIFATGADGTWRLYPSVSYGTLDILPLEPSASWAGKRSQILAGVTRLNGREPHW